MSPHEGIAPSPRLDSRRQHLRILPHAAIQRSAALWDRPHQGTVPPRRKSAANLALACFNCNTFKASNAAGYDPTTGELTRLFNPRADVWSEHFSWVGPELVGSTPVGRTTIDVLRINLAERIEHRRLLTQLGEYGQIA